MNEASYYTLGHGRERFIHQHLVDAYGAQHARPDGPAIGAAFSLAGLYLAVERGFTGLQVQRIHMVMASRTKVWPRFVPPADLGTLTVADVLAAEPGPDREQALMDWCAGVWESWRSDHGRVREMVDRFL